MDKVRKKKGVPSIFTGIIVPTQWDARGRATKIAIATTKEEEYFIAPEKKGAEMFPLIRKRVEVAGKVFETEEGKILVVDEYILKDDSVPVSAPQAERPQEPARVPKGKRAGLSKSNNAASKRGEKKR